MENLELYVIENQHKSKINIAGKRVSILGGMLDFCYFSNCRIGLVSESALRFCTFTDCIFVEDVSLIASAFIRCDFQKTTFEKPAYTGMPSSFVGSNFIACKIDDTMRARLQIVPQEGEFIGWKKCAGGAIAKLRIPADAKRSSATGRKCRANRAFVEAIYRKNEEGKDELVHQACSHFDYRFVYTAGMEVFENEFDPKWQYECTHGIHFYLSRQEAEQHVF